MPPVLDTIRLDAADTVFFEKDLEQKKAQAIEKKYPELKGRRFVPMGTNYDAAVETITYEMLDQVGMAKVITNYANDFPRADVKGVEYSIKVKSLGSAFGYSVMDIRRARMAGRPLPERKSNAARKAILEKDDRIIALGESDHGLVGLLNHPNIPIVSAIDIGGGVTAWASKTADQLLADLFLFESTIETNTKGVEQPDTLLLPPSAYAIIATKRIENTETTVLEFFLRKARFIRNIDTWHYLETAGAGGVKRAMAYRRDPDYVEHPVPQDFEYPVPAQLKGMEYEQVCHARVGGVLVIFPLSAVYMDGL